MSADEADHLISNDGLEYKMFDEAETLILGFKYNTLGLTDNFIFEPEYKILDRRPKT